jgi:hypothetical protein
VACHTEREFPCGDPCDNPLECGNHKCEQGCHVITRSRRHIEDDRGVVVEVKLEAADERFVAAFTRNHCFQASFV